MIKDKRIIFTIRCRCASFDSNFLSIYTNIFYQVVLSGSWNLFLIMTHRLLRTVNFIINLSRSSKWVGYFCCPRYDRRIRIELWFHHVRIRRRIIFYINKSVIRVSRQIIIEEWGLTIFSDSWKSLRNTKWRCPFSLNWFKAPGHIVLHFVNCVFHGRGEARTLAEGKFLLRCWEIHKFKLSNQTSLFLTHNCRHFAFYDFIPNFKI